MNSFCDAHCHLGDPKLSKSEVEDWLTQTQDGGIKTLVLGGYEPSEWRHQLEIQRAYLNRVLTCFGVHPWSVIAHPQEALDRFDAFKEQAFQCDLWGEWGLDFGSKLGAAESLKGVQVELLGRFLQFYFGLPIAERKPVVFHIVHAHEEFLGLLKQFILPTLVPRHLKERVEPTRPWAMIHAFSGSSELAERYLRQGLMLSLGSAFMRGALSKKIKVLELLEKPEWKNRFTFESDATGPGLALMVFRVAEGVGQILNRPGLELLAQASSNMRKMQNMRNPEPHF